MTTIDLQALGDSAADALDGVAVGDPVMAWEADGPLEYLGPDKHGARFVLVIGATTGVHCPAGHVAPASTPIVTDKDHLFTVSKGAPSFHGSWRLWLPGATVSHHETKRDAVTAGRRRLTIASWHAARKKPEHHEMRLTPDDKYEHLANPYCTCGGWAASGFVRREIAEQLYDTHMRQTAGSGRDGDAA